MNSSEKICILVGGMHRSGTSALTGVLELLGVSLGNELLPANRHNEKGYFENAAAFKLNEKILGDLGVTWHTSFALAENWLQHNARERWIAEIRDFIKSEFENDLIFAIKDPRLSILLPIWMEALDREHIEKRIIIPIRKPSEVTKSLSGPHRKIDLKTPLLWIDYNLGAEKHSRKSSRLYVEFDRLLDQPRITCRKILDLIPELKMDEDTAYDKVSDFLEKGLKHFNFQNPSLQSSQSMSMDLWELLQDLAEYDSPEIQSRIDIFASKHLQIVKEYGKPFEELGDQELSLSLEPQNYMFGIQEETEVTKNIKNRIKIQEVNKSLNNLKHKIATLESDLVLARKESEVARDTIKKLSEEVREKEQTNFKLQEVMGDLRSELLKNEEKARQKQQSLRQRVQLIQNEIETVKGERDEQTARNNKLQAQVVENQQVIQDTFNHVRNLQNHSNNLARDVKNLRESISFKMGWIITRPVFLILRPFGNFNWVSKGLRILPDILFGMIRNPISIWKQINIENLLVLRSALENEPIGDIRQNMHNLMHPRSNGINDPLLSFDTRLILSKQEEYAEYLLRNKDTEEQISRMKENCLNFAYRPIISIITPVYNTDVVHLEKCILSVVRQYYDNWELCIHDDCSTSAETLDCLRRWKGIDPRIKISYGSKNQHISLASNAAINLAHGEFVGLLDHDDELTPDALYYVIEALNVDTDLDFIYSDEDKIEEDETLSDPHFKSDFNFDLFLSHNYICHFSVVRKSIGDKIGWFRPGFEGSQDYDLFLRIIEQTPKIKHISKVLYHWRKTQTSTANAISNKDYYHKTSVAALRDYVKRNHLNAQICDGLFHGSWRVRRNIEVEKLVSIIIPFKDEVGLLRQCVSSILTKTSYKKYELLLISNNSTNQETFRYLSSISDEHNNIRFYEYNVLFNFSKINNWALQHARGEILLFLNNDTEVISEGWLSAMIEHIQRPEVGAVGAKLLFPNRTIQHAGVVLGIGGVAAHVHNNLPRSNVGYFGRASITQDLSACTAACLMVKKTVFEEVDGFEEEGLKIAFNDIDLCLKIRAKGYLIVYTPFAELIHHESISRGYEDTPEKKKRFRNEVLFFQQKWKHMLAKGDPFYNSNLTLEKTDFSLRI